MRHVVVRYKVKPEWVEANEELIAAVFEELAERDPGGIRYASLQLADGVSGLALRVDAASMQLDQALRDCEAEPAAA